MHSHTIASDLSYEVFQLRRLRGELGSQAFDSTHRRLNRVSGYRAFIPDVVDDRGDTAVPVPVTVAVGSDE
jgi:hypothetical protein